MLKKSFSVAALGLLALTAGAGVAEASHLSSSTATHAADDSWPAFRTFPAHHGTASAHHAPTHGATTYDDSWPA